MIIHPLTHSSSPRWIWGSRLQTIWWRCCCFLWQSEQTGCLYLEVKKPISLINLVVGYLKLTIFKTSWFSLHIKPLQFYTASIHSIFDQVHKLSSDNNSFYLERKMKCTFTYELSLIPLLMSRFYLILARIQCLSLLLKLLIFILLCFPYCRVCSALRWKQCTWTYFTEAALGVWCLWICLCDGESNLWFRWQ